MLRFYRAYLLYYWGGMHRYFGIANGVKREFERAAYYFGRAFEVDPTFRRARLDRAIMLGRELGRFEEALAEFDALLADDHRDADARLNRAMTRQDMGDFAGALVDYEAYLRLPDITFADSVERSAGRLRDLLREAT